VDKNGFLGYWRSDDAEPHSDGRRTCVDQWHRREVCPLLHPLELLLIAKPTEFIIKTIDESCGRRIIPLLGPKVSYEFTEATLSCEECCIGTRLHFQGV
jgi:hypothetical protein